MLGPAWAGKIPTSMPMASTTATTAVAVRLRNQLKPDVGAVVSCVCFMRKTSATRPAGLDVHLVFNRSN